MMTSSNDKRRSKSRRCSTPSGITRVSSFAPFPPQTPTFDQHVLERLDESFFPPVSLVGSAREFVEARILGGFLQNDEFGLGDRHALRVEQQVGEILVATAPSEKGFDVAVDGFYHSEAYLRATEVQDAIQVIQQQVSEVLKRHQPLPPQLINPTLEIAQHGSF